jgi:beta-lactamase regulating signal transducer with metallopeptidase domain
MDTLTLFCDYWWSWALAASWQLALLVVLIALVAGLSRRLSARFRYALWTLVLIKVFLPPSLGLPWSVGSWAGGVLPEPPVASVVREAPRGTLRGDPGRGPGALETGRGPAGETDPLSREAPVSEPAAVPAAGEAGLPSGFEPRESAAARAGPALTSPGRASAWSDWLAWSRRALGPLLMAAWALGAFAMLSIIGIRYARLTRGFRSAEEVDEGPLRVLLERLAQRLGCETAPDLILSERVTSPFLCGVFRPRIVLPASLPGALQAEELESVLLHELVHWKRGDVVIGWAQVASQALFWFHPLVWFANSRVRHERESACDEAALALGQPGPEKYGESLLKVLLAARGRSAAAVGYLGIFERNTKLQRRLEDIMNLEKKNRKLGAWGWTFIALFAVAFLPMAGAEDPGSRPPSVHFVLGDREMTFEGEKTTLEEIRSRLEKVPDRAGTALCFAVDTLALTLEKVEPVKGKLMQLSKELGFKYFSDIGVHPLGSYGTASSPYNDRLVKQVTVDIDKSPENTRLSVQYAVMAICKAAGIPYQWDKTAKLADPMRRRYIDPLQVKDVLVEKALLDVLNPVGLRFDLDKDGLYLRYPGGFQEESPGRKAVVEAAASSLQREIDAAPTGATVKVPAGKHAGPLVITKPLTLKGEGREASAIELLGNDPAIFVRGAKGVSIEDLTVRWSPKSTDERMENPAAVAVRDADVTLRRCGLEPIERPDLTPYGLLASGRSSVTFTEGYSTGFAYALMFIDGAAGTVSDSFLQKAGHSVVTLHPGSVVKIERNILARCGYHAVRNTGGTMEMTSNLVADNAKAGAYLGNRSAHGTIADNLFTGSDGEIWGFSGFDVELRNNVFWKSRRAAVGLFRDTCRLKLVRNSFAGNPVGIGLYSGSKDSKQAGTTAEGNHYWQNAKDTENFEKEPTSISGVDPKFADPATGNFQVPPDSPLVKDGKALAGLENPEPIRKLWATYSAKKE